MEGGHPWLRDRRLGFAVKVVGAPTELKSNDARRAASDPHLRVSLGYLREIFAYLGKAGLDMYRMSSELAPYVTHPDHPRFHRQLEECEAEIRALGEQARKQDLRLSFHPSQYILLASPEERITRASAAEFAWQATMLDWMGLGPEAVVVTHVGGAYDDKPAAMARWIRNYEALPEAVRARIVLENDDRIYGVNEVRWIHDRCGVRLVFDYQHHLIVNPDRTPLREALQTCLGTWPAGVKPKIHFSCPATAYRQVAVRGGKANETQAAPPDVRNHADFVGPFEFAWFMSEVGDLAFDVMLEAKAKDAAVLRLRHDLARLDPMIRAARPGGVTFLPDGAEARLKRI